MGNFNWFASGGIALPVPDPFASSSRCDKRQERPDKPIRCKEKPVVQDVAIGSDDDEPRSSAGTVGPHDCGHSAYWGQVSNRMPEGNMQSISSLIFPQTIEGVDLRTFEHGLNGRQANVPIAQFIRKCHEHRKAMPMTTRTPILKEVQYLKPRP